MAPSIKAYLLAASWAGLSAAHLIMKSPVPFGVDTLNNSPLAPVAIGSATSDFPCKQRTGVYKVSEMNNMPVGQAQELSFTGSASHGGGTCQLAVSLDHEPTANSTWKIIQVYEGGCPTSGSGNGGTDTFSFKIPEKFPNGQATLAWTWYNRIGNREIYMNCAPITVSGGADNNDFYNTLPDMYVINLPPSDCSTVESTNQIIPNPGQFILKGDATDKSSEATGPGCAAAAAAQMKGVSGNQGPFGNATEGNGAATAATTAASTVASTPNNGAYSPMTTAETAQATTAVVSTTPMAVPTSAAVESSLPLSLMITVPSISRPVATDAPIPSVTSYVAPTMSSAAAVAPAPSALAGGPSPPMSSATAVAQTSSIALTSLVTAYTTAPAATSNMQSSSMNDDEPSSVAGTPAATPVAGTPPPAATTPAAAPTIAYSAPASNPTGAAVSGNTCPQDGALLCNGPNQFGLCDHGKVVWQSVASGTVCSNGAITKRDEAVKLGRKEQLGRWFAVAA